MWKTREIRTKGPFLHTRSRDFRDRSVSLLLSEISSLGIYFVISRGNQWCHYKMSSVATVKRKTNLKKLSAWSEKI